MTSAATVEGATPRGASKSHGLHARRRREQPGCLARRSTASRQPAGRRGGDARPEPHPGSRGDPPAARAHITGRMSAAAGTAAATSLLGRRPRCRRGAGGAAALRRRGTCLTARAAALGAVARAALAAAAAGTGIAGPAGGGLTTGQRGQGHRGPQQKRRHGKCSSERNVKRKGNRANTGGPRAAWRPRSRLQFRHTP